MLWYEHGQGVHDNGTWGRVVE